MVREGDGARAHRSVVAATIGVDWHGVRFEFTTRNRKRRPEWLELALETRPVPALPRRVAAEAARRATVARSTSRSHYEFASDLLGRVASPVFERITNTLVDAFVQRADQLGERIPALSQVNPNPPGRSIRSKADDAAAGVDAIGDAPSCASRALARRRRLAVTSESDHNVTPAPPAAAGVPGARPMRLAKHVKFREEKFGGVLFETRSEKVYTLNPTATAVVREIQAGSDEADDPRCA